jgi:hypothetical protein
MTPVRLDGEVRVYLSLDDVPLAHLWIFLEKLAALIL